MQRGAVSGRGGARRRALALEVEPAVPGAQPARGAPGGERALLDPESRLGPWFSARNTLKNEYPTTTRTEI